MIEFFLLLEGRTVHRLFFQTYGETFYPRTRNIKMWRNLYGCFKETFFLRSLRPYRPSGQGMREFWARSVFNRQTLPKTALLSDASSGESRPTVLFLQLLYSSPGFVFCDEIGEAGRKEWYYSVSFLGGKRSYGQKPKSRRDNLCNSLNS